MHGQRRKSRNERKAGYTREENRELRKLSLFRWYILENKSICKPSSVHGMQSHAMIISLRVWLPKPFSSLPENKGGHPIRFPIWPCTQRGLPHGQLPGSHEWALTPLFHPYLISHLTRRFTFCCTFRRLLALGVTQLCVHWCSDFPPAKVELCQRSSDRLIL